MLETTIRWRPYPEQKPEGFSGIYSVLTERGSVMDGFWDSFGWTTTDEAEIPLVVQAFALESDIVTREVEPSPTSGEKEKP